MDNHSVPNPARHPRVIGDDGPGVHSDDVCSGANPVGHTVGIDAGVVLLRRGDAQGRELHPRHDEVRGRHGTLEQTQPPDRHGAGEGALVKIAVECRREVGARRDSRRGEAGWLRSVLPHLLPATSTLISRVIQCGPVISSHRAA